MPFVALTPAQIATLPDLIAEALETGAEHGATRAQLEAAGSVHATCADALHRLGEVREGGLIIDDDGSTVAVAHGIPSGWYRCSDGARYSDDGSERVMEIEAANAHTAAREYAVAAFDPSTATVTVDVCPIDVHGDLIEASATRLPIELRPDAAQLAGQARGRGVARDGSRG